MVRGRKASSPLEIPARGWKDIAFRVKDEIASDHVGLIAAGVAFYALLALFPAITALMALAGLVLEPADVTRQLEAAAALIPEDAAQIVLDQATSVAGSRETGLGLAFVFGLGIAIYSSSKGMSSLIEGLNVAYDEEERRGFFKKMALTLVLTVVLMVGLIVGLICTMLLPAVLDLLPLPDWLKPILAVSRWIVLVLMTMLGLSILYRFAPCRDKPQWQWLTPGSVAACAIWIVASFGFSLYVSNFGSYNESFGSLAGVIILLMWLWISAFVILLGAELNAEMEAQTRADTTVGPDEPMGTRGAKKADELGERA